MTPGSPYQLKLFFLEARANPEVFVLQTDSAVLGSSPQCDVCLRDPLLPNGAIFLKEVNGGFIVRNTHPGTPVRVNGAPVKEAMLSNGTLLEIGKFKMQVQLTPGVGKIPGAANIKVVVDPPLAESTLMAQPQQRRVNHIEAALKTRVKKERGGQSFAKQIGFLSVLVAAGYFYIHNPDFNKIVGRYIPVDKAADMIKNVVSTFQGPKPAPAVAKENTVNPMSVADLLKNGPPKLPPPVPAEVEASLKELDGATPAPSAAPTRAQRLPAAEPAH